MSRRGKIRRNLAPKVELLSANELKYGSAKPKPMDDNILDCRRKMVADSSNDIQHRQQLEGLRRKNRKVRDKRQRYCKIDKINDGHGDDDNGKINVNDSGATLIRDEEQPCGTDDFESFQYRQSIGQFTDNDSPVRSSHILRKQTVQSSKFVEEEDEDESLHDILLEDSDEADAILMTEDDDTSDIFAEYRRECEQLIRSSATQLDKEDYVALLERIVGDLLEQNQCLNDNLAEIRKEANERVRVMHRKLEKSAKRTEETMLSLQSHEIELKQFVQRHCCQCCGCDMRLWEFRLCHAGGQCCCCCSGSNEIEFLSGPSSVACHQPSQSNTFQQHCPWSHNTEWNLIVSQMQSWSQNRTSQIDCTFHHHHQPNRIRFVDLVDRVNHRIQQLELDNDEMKHENQLIRELNSMLSGRKGYISMNSPSTGVATVDVQSTVPKVIETPVAYASRRLRNRLGSVDSDSLSLNQLFESEDKGHGQGDEEDDEDEDENEEMTQDLITFLSKSAKHDLLSSYLGDNQLEEMCQDNASSCCASSSRSESMNSRQDNDSGCSTDLIPSQTDMHSLMLSDCEDTIDTVLSSIHAEVKELTSTQNDQTQETTTAADNHHQLRTQLNQAQRLVPKLYNKLLFYLNQRNQLLRQFQHETRERKKCKQELSSLVDCLVLGLKGVETNSKRIKQLQHSSTLSY